MNNTLLRWSMLLIISILSVSSTFSYSVDKEKVAGTVERTFSSEGPNPVVTFTVYEPTGKEEMDLPPSVDFWRSEQMVDEDGVSCFKINNGRLVYNVSTVAFQAMGSASSYPNLDLDELAVGKSSLSDRQKRALGWLEQHRVVLRNGSHIWYYNFPLNYNNIVVTSDWPSAFSQAALIHAYLVVYRITGEEWYVDLATKAALAYEIDTDHGGLTSTVDGMLFYEEVPLSHGYSPHVLNAHLYTTAMLIKLAEITHDAQVERLAREGVKTAKALLLEYDMGYWTRYDLRPRLKDIPFQFEPPVGGREESPIYIRSLSLTAPDSTTYSIELTKSGRHRQAANVYWGNGWAEIGKSGRALRSSAAYASFELPGKPPLSYRDFPGYRLKVEYSGGDQNPPNAYILGFRDRIKEYYDLPLERVEKLGEHIVASYRVDVRDLQWSYLQRYYVDWHTRTIYELWKLTRDPFFRVTWVRWSQYLTTYDTDLAAEPQGDHEPALRRRPFPVYTADTGLTRYVYQALEILPDEAINTSNIVLALLRYAFFRLKLGEASSSKPLEIIEQGGGSCAHFSTVFQGFSQYLGIASRVWSLYDIPLIGGHNLAEARIDGEWRAIDPCYGVFYTTEPAWSAPMVSVQELLERGGKGYHMWFVTEYGDLERGKTPVTSGMTIEKAFALHKKHPLTYDPEIIFSTPQVGVRGEEMLYSANWLIDLAQAKDGHYFIGKRDFSGESDMWSGLVGLRKNYNEIVSLHELGRSSIHTVLQSYHLKGLEPGMVYRFEIGVSYASQPDLGTQMRVRDLTLDKMLDLSGLFEYGCAKHPQLSVIFFEAEADEHIVDLQVRDKRGYVLLNYIELEKTSMAALPRNVSYGAKVVDKTRFYDGYGPENALDGDPFNNFVAARESTLPNSFTIDTGKPVIPVALNLIWNSAKEYGVDFTFKAGPGGEVTLLDVRSNRPQNSRSNRFFLPSDRVYRYYQFVVNRAAGQERLLLLDFDLIGAPPPESGQPTKVQSENEDMLFPRALQ